VIVAELRRFLATLLAESINTNERRQSAQIREALRCLAPFDARAVRALLRALNEEHRKRTHYQLVGTFSFF
jgi:hypothetical protein